MDIAKLIVGKLETSLTAKEKVHFKNWKEASYTNELLFYRLEVLKRKGIDFSKITYNINTQLAWKHVKKELE
ncbi:hypothetical protein [Flavivirga eckloniae]|uniref:Uncharacterized protein n=1 Tax=Flavivirga eckloniae TaxID=1803846 RepID=A0A2K9PVV6_9FLAO|nr:hypothetical protein [Flavivirga eckloniae]AUP81189.1 hypothetical protein C1H87_21720 [Flavivirga eckloniae]